ncbi:MAG: beta-galactosidase [Victivallales bacterium]|nr:beta-galactosidase [Victivallales bacterium]
MLAKLKKILAAEKMAMLPPDSSKEEIYDYNADPVKDRTEMEFIGRMPYKRSIDIAASRLGIGFETLDRETFDPKKVFPFLANSGVKWARCQTGWMRTEKQPGVFDFKWLDEVVDGLEAIGIQAWFSIGFGNPLYTPCEKFAATREKAEKAGTIVPGWARGYVGETPFYHGPEAMEAWKRYVKALVKHFKGRIRHWEIWNEPEFFWRHKNESILKQRGIKVVARDYGEFVRFTAEAVREVYPDAQIIANVAEVGTCLVTELGKNGLGEIIDIMTYHFYGNIPERFMKERTEHLRTNIEVKGRPLQLWQGESGRASGKSAWFAFPTEYNQAKYLVRRHINDLACGVELSSFFTVSDFLAYYEDGSDQFYGIIDAGKNKPKLAFYAMQTLGWLFDGLENAPDLLALLSPRNARNFCSSIPYRVETAAFRRKGVPVFCVWTPENVDISAPPIDAKLKLVIDVDTPLEQPILIDPIRRNVWAINSQLTESKETGAIHIDNFRVIDYPLFVTDAKIFTELTS